MLRKNARRCSVLPGWLTFPDSDCDNKITWEIISGKVRGRLPERKGQSEKNQETGREEDQILRKKYIGCLMGLAAGDAMGAAVEFLTATQIRARYGDRGICEFDAWRGFPAGAYTDDTQMSLATAAGLLEAARGWKPQSVFDPAPFVYRAYLEWLSAQADPLQRRAPGQTCLQALESGVMGTIETPINDSKGCGGVMRTAPVGLAFSHSRAFHEGARYAAITHGHPSGYLSAGFLAETISHILEGLPLEEAVGLSRQTLLQYPGYEETEAKISQAERLAAGGAEPLMAIKHLGEGWVGEEALGIALYCALIFEDEFREGIRAAVNHSGDSDSTGAITGALLGAALGVSAIPSDWRSQLENAEALRRTAEELFALFRQSPSAGD